MDMTRKEAENEGLRARMDDFRDSLAEDNEWIGAEINGGYSHNNRDRDEKFGHLAMTIYRASKFIDRIARGDKIEEIPAYLELEAFREFLRVKKSLVDEIDGILDAAVADEFGVEK